jgi:glyoxylase-like metal-dependent hydrolase (beta-lactamase superfamily II)
MHALSNDCWAWLQPDGGWGWSNAGLITDGDCSMLVDTLYDLRMTGEMLAYMRDTTKAARQIDILVNSHADGDHTYGNQLVSGARIIASAATANEFFKVTPQTHQTIVENAEIMGEGAQYIAAFIRDHGFKFSDITLTPPTETYESQVTIKVGDKDVRLINVGPAHTAGDTLVHSVKDRVIYTGDILFLGVHPAIWEGSPARWIDACDLIMSLDIDTVVPGHGPLTDKAGVKIFKTYLEIVRHEARIRYEAGMTVEEAAADIRFDPPYDSWLVPERVVGSVNFLYREWGSPYAETDYMKVFDMVARYANRRAECLAGRHSRGCGHSH